MGKTVSKLVAYQSLFLPVIFSYSIDSTLFGSEHFYSPKLFLFTNIIVRATVIELKVCYIASYIKLVSQIVNFM